MTKNSEAGAKSGKDEQCLIEAEDQGDESQSLADWAGLARGDLVSLQDATTQRCVVGSVDEKTSDGLIIWIRDGLNERKAYHYGDCLAARNLGSVAGRKV